MDNEPGGSKVGKINCAEAGGLAEDYIGFTGICFGMKCTNDQVIKAVPVDISGFGNAESGKFDGSRLHGGQASPRYYPDRDRKVRGRR